MLYNRWNIAENIAEWLFHIPVIDDQGMLLQKVAKNCKENLKFLRLGRDYRNKKVVKQWMPFTPAAILLGIYFLLQYWLHITE